MMKLPIRHPNETDAQYFAKDSGLRYASGDGPKTWGIVRISLAVLFLLGGYSLSQRAQEIETLRFALSTTSLALLVWCFIVYFNWWKWTKSGPPDLTNRLRWQALRRCYYSKEIAKETFERWEPDAEVWLRVRTFLEKHADSIPKAERMKLVDAANYAMEVIVALTPNEFPKEFISSQEAQKLVAEARERLSQIATEIRTPSPELHALTLPFDGLNSPHRAPVSL
jgi:hypothetical protein